MKINLKSEMYQTMRDIANSKDVSIAALIVKILEEYIKTNIDSEQGVTNGKGRNPKN